MKKINFTKSLLAIFLVAVVAVNVSAQKKLVNKANLWAEQGIKLDTALGAINAAIKNEKTAEMPKTYYTKAMVLQAIYHSDNDEFKNLSDDPLLESFDLLQKTYNMEKAGVLKGMIDANLLTLQNLVVKEAIEAYKVEDHEKAYRYFNKSLTISEMEVFEDRVDTAIVFNAGFCAQKAELYNEAIDLYKQSIDLEYGGGDIYRLLRECYNSLGDSITGLNILKEGFAKNPGDQTLVLELLNYYLIEKNNPDKAFEYLAVAKENDPTNAQLFVAEGQLYDKMDETDKAIEQYKKAIEMDPTLFYAYYNLGVIIFNQAVELMEEASKIVDNAKFIKARDIANEKFKESLPYIEKSHELQPEDTSIISTLKTLYYRLGMTDKYNEMDALLQ